MIQTKKQNDQIMNSTHGRQSSCKFPRTVTTDMSNIVKSDQPKLKPKKKV